MNREMWKKKDVAFPEKECASCSHFRKWDGDNDFGNCLIEKRGGKTSGRYICPEWLERLPPTSKAPNGFLIEPVKESKPKARY